MICKLALEALKCATCERSFTGPYYENKDGDAFCAKCCADRLRVLMKEREVCGEVEERKLQEYDRAAPYVKYL